MADSSAVDGHTAVRNEAATFLNQVYRRADAFLFGRRTYEIFARSWGRGGRSGHQSHRRRLNTRTQVRGIEPLAVRQPACR